VLHDFPRKLVERLHVAVGGKHTLLPLSPSPALFPKAEFVACFFEFEVDERKMEDKSLVIPDTAAGSSLQLGQKYHYITSQPQVEEALARLKECRLIAVDCEGMYEDLLMVYRPPAFFRTQELI